MAVLIGVCVCLRCCVGASRVLRWEQTVVLGPTSGVSEQPAELKVKMKVSALELQRETGISRQALRHILDIAGNRCVVGSRVFLLAMC